MKFKLILVLAIVVGLYTACKKDLGNYDYHPPSEPTLSAFKDSTFSALLGDSLILKPSIGLANADPQKDLSFEWRIDVAEEIRSDVYTGYPLKIVYNLAPGLRTAKLIITDKRNGLKYVVPFKVLGTTQFSSGKLVLSDDNGIARLSFVKPDNKTVLADIYKSFHGEDLPSNPVQLYFQDPLPYQPITNQQFWVLCNDPAKKSPLLDASTLLRKAFFNDQFFTPPNTITTGRLEAYMGTVPTGVINGKLYVGVMSTAPFAPDYGKFANEQAGDYTLSKYFTRTNSFYFGFDTKSKGFVTFGGDGSYLGKDYVVDTAGKAFDPKNIGYDNLLFMQTGQAGMFYAYFKAADGNIYELGFSYTFDSVNKKIKAESKRLFKGASLVNADTKWLRNSLNVFYFTANDKIYRYNPLNEDLKVLDADFGGKKISMLKVSADDNTLTVGTAGSVYTVDVSVGKNGVITQTITGIPGSPVDIVMRK
ncbi:PKD-like family lipoprotein [Pedobacter rhizosphaerae]|uniref:PKD-like family protein n=1 Tax=Pedobacter rhizosphaerae TaxID=390241 RepID=A0A1H9UVL4_9SPHI|nr:PKD-like family lipoprotein [Pedobacter rhizosphaerae]SES13456.1 PKD-like family protein [Pedobacter rhizosphaerae]